MIRLSDNELENLLQDLESYRVERTISFEKSDKFREAICAFANDLPNNGQPGILFIGVDNDGNPTNQVITDQLLLTLNQIKTDGQILPLPTLAVEKRILKGCEMAVVTVLPSDMPPVKYKGRIWVRSGPGRSLANEQEERILNEKRRFKHLPFDLTPVPSAKISDLSRLIFENEYLPAAFAPDILEANGRTYEERLSSCRMIGSPEDTTPTVLGLLTLGTSPQDFLPGATIQFLRIAGTHLTDAIADEEKISGTFSDILRRTQEILSAHNRTQIDVTTGATHRIAKNYALTALLQLVYNAILHRTYESTHSPIRLYWFDDRIELQSPGGPYGNVTNENFGKPGITDYRNPNIAEVLKTLGYVQSFGRGIAIARDACKKNNQPEPVFEVNQSIVNWTLRPSL